MPFKIKKITAIEILDSRGEPTLETTVELNNGTIGSAAVPSGASTGKYEAYELRDQEKSRFGGKGVLRAIDNVNNIINKELNGISSLEQAKIDGLLIKLDGTQNKSKLGANAILSVSLAVARAGALASSLPLYKYLRNLYDPKITDFKLPTPVINVINGGAHADTNLNLQEFWICPVGQVNFADKIRQASEVFHALGNIFKSYGLDTDLGNEGGYAPNFTSHQQVLELLIKAIGGKDMVLGIDSGASEFFDSTKNLYNLSLENKILTSEELMDWYIELINEYPIKLIEDPFDQEDWVAWRNFTNDHIIKDNNIKIIGDDLFVTNPKRLQKGIDLGAANAILIKLNQIGTLSETLETIRLARQNNYQVIISHRSGETTDTTIADLAVAVNSDFIKTGSVARGERIAKYNRLLKIETEL